MNSNEQPSTNQSSNKRSTGNYGEQLAEEFLKNLGYEIIKKNFHYGHGEIDLIAKDKDVLVFVEVKYRKNLDFGEPEYSVNKSKQNQIRKIAEAYLAINKITDRDSRIDVIAILQLSGEKPQINHYINAF
jgi:putative endonuclease